MVKNRRFNLPHLYLAPPSGVTPLEFRRDLWHQKTRRMVLSCGIKISPVFFGLFTKHACDRQTDRRTDRITTPKTALAQLRRAVKTERNSSEDEIANVNFLRWHPRPPARTLLRSAPRKLRIRKITQNKGHYVVEDHSMSPILLPIETSLYDFL